MGKTLVNKTDISASLGHSRSQRIFCLYDFWECARFLGLRAILGLVGLVQSCHRTFLGVSWIQKIFLVVFSWAHNFSRGNFMSESFLSWVFHCSISFFLWLVWWFKDFHLLAAWERVIENRNNKYISNRVFYSKSISVIVSSVNIRKVLHLLNYSCYYAAFICTDCIFSHLFLVLGSLYV